MKQLLLGLTLAARLFAQEDPAPQQVHLAPGEYRWIPLTVKQVPTEVVCKYQVSAGNPGVHAELLTMRDFRLMVRGLQHESLAISREGQNAEFRRIIDFKGQYAVVLTNRKDAGPVAVSFEVRTDVDPASAAVAQTLPAQRKLVVILISFSLFFAAVVWSGMKLMRAIRE